MISPKKWQQCRCWMASLEITEEDITETFVIGRGSGGQKLHKTASCVQLRHAPTEIVVKCQAERSRELNRYRARMRLCEKVEARMLGLQSKQQQAIAKIRRQKKRRTRKAKEKILKDKRHTAALKTTRQKPGGVD